MNEIGRGRDEKDDGRDVEGDAELALGVLDFGARHGLRNGGRIGVLVLGAEPVQDPSVEGVDLNQIWNEECLKFWMSEGFFGFWYFLYT